ncbi:hypothetical protein MRX96_035272 [Rhipicephalus microplus]
MPSSRKTRRSTLKQQVVGMKKNKVTSAAKIEAERICHQETEKIAQMLKASCQQGKHIRCLEIQNRTKKMYLKQHHEEMATLRRQIFSASRTIFKASL